MPRIRRMDLYMKGYIKGARKGVDPKINNKPSTRSVTTSGRSHHFFSWRRKRKNSLINWNMTTANDVTKGRVCQARLWEASGRGDCLDGCAKALDGVR